MKANGIRFKAGSFLVRTGLRIMGVTCVSVTYEKQPMYVGPIVEYINDNLPSSACPPDYKTVQRSFTDAEQEQTGEESDGNQ